MQEVFEKIKQRIAIVETEACGYSPMTKVVSGAELKEIIDDVAKQLNNGWIPVESGKLPENEKEVEITFRKKHYKTGETLYLRACQVKCVSSFSHLFPQLRAV